MTTSRQYLMLAGVLALAAPLSALANEETDNRESWTRRHAQARALGYDHHDASRIATLRAPATKEEIEYARNWMRDHKAAMDRGMGHQDASNFATAVGPAREAARDAAADQEWMRRHKAAMDRGMTHQDASMEADRR